MGYATHSRQVLTVHEKSADNLAATGDDLVLDICQPMTIRRIGCTITTAVVSSAGVVVAADRRVTTGSDSGRVAGLNSDGDGVITIPAGTAAGKVVYKDVNVDVNPGDQIVFEVTTAAAGGGAAGNGRYFVEAEPRDEVAANLSDMVESA